VDRHGRVAGEGLSDRTVACIVQGAAERAGLDPKAFAGHSLRAGFATTAAKKGKSLDAIMRQTLHKSEEVARGYIRHASSSTTTRPSVLPSTCGRKFVGGQRTRRSHLIALCRT
jgi:integrase